MKKIICIMGKSGSGKSTIIDNVYSKNKDLFYPITSFTTRAPRNEEDLKTHIFVDDIFYENHKDQAIAMYHSNHGYHSWVDDSAFKDKKINLYAIDPNEFIKFYKKYNNRYKIYGIYLYVDEEERKKRLKKRGQDNYYSQEEHLSLDILKKSCLEENIHYNVIDISNKTINNSGIETINIIANKII